MPTYAYRCAACGHAFDIHQSFTDESLTVCPECGGPLRKQYGSIGVTFKGSGFYRTDSRSGSSSSTPAKAPAAKSTTASTSSSTTSTPSASA